MLAMSPRRCGLLAASLDSKVRHTLEQGELTEVYYPDLGTPSIRDMQLVVTDGRTFADRERDDTKHEVQLVDRRSLTYRQIDTAKSGAYRIVKTCVSDPGRSTLLVDVRFQSLTGKPYKVYALLDPALSNDGNDDSGTARRGTLLTQDAKAGSALIASTSLGRTSTGYLDASDGWTDLRDDFTMDWTYRSSPNGNVVQTAQTGLDGVRHRHLQLALGLGADSGAALANARTSMKRGFRTVARAYAAGWHRYLGSLNAPPASAAPYGPEYDVSLMTLAAHEDKTHRGAFIASPTMPWSWGTGFEQPTSGVYHAVWSRDLYQIVTAMMAAGDRGAAERALTFVFEHQQKPDGSVWQNTYVDGTPHWTNVQMDEVAFPIVLAWQLGRDDADTYSKHVKPAADYIVANGPRTNQDRWENQDGWSPGTIGAEIAGLVTAADLARKAGAPDDAARYEATADDWQRNVEKWTATTNGPYSTGPYYLRLTRTPTRTTAARTRSATAGRQRPTSAPWSTRASSSSCASASSARTIRRSSTRSRSPTTGWPSTRPTAASGTASTSTATASSATAPHGTASRPTARRPSAARGRSSPASAASTSSPPARRRPRSWPPWPAPPTTAT
jgi:glucoamylase